MTQEAGNCIEWEIHLHTTHPKTDFTIRNRTGSDRVLAGHMLYLWTILGKTPERQLRNWMQCFIWKLRCVDRARYRASEWTHSSTTKIELLGISKDRNIVKCLPRSGSRSVWSLDRKLLINSRGHINRFLALVPLIACIDGNPTSKFNLDVCDQFGVGTIPS